MGFFTGCFAKLRLGSAAATRITPGTGSPESAVTGAVGDVFLRTDGGDGTTLYVKASGSGNTGWKAIPTLSSTGTFTNKVGTISSTSVTLTDAQTKALPTTGITIVSAPAAGFRNKFFSATLLATIPATIYTNINATYASIQLQTPSGNWLSLPVLNDTGTTPDLTEVSGLLGTTGTILKDLPPYSAGPATTDTGWTTSWAPDASSNYDNDAIQIKMDNNGSGNLTGGASGNSLKCTCYYIVEAI